MTQSQVRHPPGTLPACKCKRTPRHYFDARRASANGGNFLECAPCDVRTPRFGTLAEAITDFHRLVGTTPAGKTARVHAIR